MTLAAARGHAQHPGPCWPPPSHFPPAFTALGPRVAPHAAHRLVPVSHPTCRGARHAARALQGCRALCIDAMARRRKKKKINLNRVSGLEGSWKQRFCGCVPSRCS